MEKKPLTIRTVKNIIDNVTVPAVEIKGDEKAWRFKDKEEIIARMGQELLTAWTKLEKMANAYNNLCNILAIAQNKHHDVYTKAKDYLDNKKYEEIICPKCGASWWGGGTDEHPRPWCMECGADQP